MFEETSLFRPISRVYIRDLWLEKSHRRMRLAKPFVQSSLALFCTTESKVEIRALLMERILRRGAIGEACKAAAKSLRLENRGRRILLEP